MATLSIELSDKVRALAETRARQPGHATIDHGAPADFDGGSEERLIELLDEAEATTFREMNQQDWDGLRNKVVTGRGPVGV